MKPENVSNRMPRCNKIPYVKRLQENIGKLLKYDNLKIAFKCYNTLKQIYSKLKTQTLK